MLEELFPGLVSMENFVDAWEREQTDTEEVPQ